MAVVILNTVLGSKATEGLDPVAFNVLRALAWRAHANGFCSMTLVQLQRESGYQASAVRAALLVLREANLIAFDSLSGKKGPRVFQVLVDTLCDGETSPPHGEVFEAHHTKTSPLHGEVTRGRRTKTSPLHGGTSPLHGEVVGLYRSVEDLQRLSQRQKINTPHRGTVDGYRHPPLERSASAHLPTVDEVRTSRTDQKLRGVCSRKLMTSDPALRDEIRRELDQGDHRDPRGRIDLGRLTLRAVRAVATAADIDGHDDAIRPAVHSYLARFVELYEQAQPVACVAR